MTTSVVVGVDGSALAQAALRFAAAEARLRGVVLRVVAARPIPPVAAFTGDGLTDTMAESRAMIYEALSGAQLMFADDDLPETGGRLPPTEQRPELHIEMPVGLAAQILVRTSAGAAMLVLGASGHGRVAGLLLGSTAQHCARHAQCPVVLVPALPAELTVTPGAIA